MVDDHVGYKGLFGLRSSSWAWARRSPLPTMTARPTRRSTGASSCGSHSPPPKPPARSKHASPRRGAGAGVAPRVSAVRPPPEQYSLSQRRTRYRPAAQGCSNPYKAGHRRSKERETAKFSFTVVVILLQILVTRLRIIDPFSNIASWTHCRCDPDVQA